MDRPIAYIGAIPQDTDILNTNLGSYIGLAKLSAAVLGTVSLLNNFTCIQTGTPSMSVTVSAGEIYALENIDNDTYGSIPPDTTHAIVKQGINLDTTTLTCTAPSTIGNSVNYLVQIGFSETDTGSEVLPYYNASDPSQAWSGPNNSGTPNFTMRTDSCNVNLKQGVQAPTGTQVTPSPDSGFLGAFVITVAHGATTVVTGNISVYSASNFINETLTQKISQATADLRYAQITSVQNSQYTYGVDGSVSANTVTVSLSPTLTSYVAGQSFLIKIANTNTGASTININSLGAKNITYSNGSSLASSDLVSGGIAILTYDGTVFQLKNPESGNFAPSAVQNNSYIYGNDGGTANAYTLTTAPAVASYAAGLGVIVKIANANTGACTLNVSALSTKNIKLTSGSNPSANDLVAGMEAWFVYDGTNFQLMNPNIGNVATAIQVQNGSLTYAASSTAANTYTATLSPVPSAYAAGQSFSVLFTNPNTGAATINFNSLGAKSMKRIDGTALQSGDIAAGMLAVLNYDGTNFQLVSVANVIRKVTSQIFTASGTYTAPAGLLYAIVEVVGSGGGGGGAATSAASFSAAAGGGGGGSYSKSWLTAATIGASQTVTIGNAGTGGAAGNNNGTNGADCSFGSLVIGKGGSFGGGAATANVVNYGAIGQGGIAGTGTLTIPGGNAHLGIAFGSSGMGIGGFGGATFFGAGGPSVVNAAGNTGTGYGSGGSGAASANSAAAAGGNGSKGICIVTEFVSV